MLSGCQFCRLSSNIPPAFIDPNGFVFGESRAFPGGAFKDYNLGYTLGK